MIKTFFESKHTAIIIVFTAFMLIFRHTAICQELNPACGCPYSDAEIQFAKEEELMLKVDKPASYLGGDKAFNRYLSYLIQHPAKNKNDSDNYSLLCRFIIEQDGSISRLEFLNHTEKKFENEATKIIEAMPKWHPAQKDGQAVRSWHSLKLFLGKMNKK